MRGTGESAGRLLDALGCGSQVGTQENTRTSGKMVRAENGRCPAARAAPDARRPMGIARACRP
jgi:hypothetical protein